MRQCLVPKTPARLLQHKEPSYGTAACESLLALATHIALAQAVKMAESKETCSYTNRGKRYLPAGERICQNPSSILTQEKGDRSDHH